MHQSKLLKQYPYLSHGTIARPIGSKLQQITKLLSVNQQEVQSLKQIHSNKVICISSEEEKVGIEVEEGDAMITNQKDCLIAIRTADCLPVFFYDDQKKVIALAHAGWRGLINGILKNTIKKMSFNFGVQIQNIKAFIGVALCQSCFEVGPEVLEDFRSQNFSEDHFKKGKTDRWHIDLKKAATTDLLMQGLVQKNIEKSPYCTSCHHESFYSYRRGDLTARNFNFIFMMES